MASFSYFLWLLLHPAQLRCQSKQTLCITMPIMTSHHSKCWRCEDVEVESVDRQHFERLAAESLLGFKLVRKQSHILTISLDIQVRVVSRIELQGVGSSKPPEQAREHRDLPPEICQEFTVWESCQRHGLFRKIDSRNCTTECELVTFVQTILSWQESSPKQALAFFSVRFIFHEKWQVTSRIWRGTRYPVFAGLSGGRPDTAATRREGGDNAAAGRPAGRTAGPAVRPGGSGSSTGDDFGRA